MARLAARLKQASGQSAYHRFQCVLIRATLGSPAAEIAQLPGLPTATVHMLHSRFTKEGNAIVDLCGQGGRCHQHLCVEQDLLAPFVERDLAGAILTVAKIQQACQDQVGKTVARSTIYRLLDRHCWRKVEPRPRHPKADGAAQSTCKEFHCQVRREVAR